MSALQKAHDVWGEQALEKGLRESVRWRALVLLDAARPEYLSDAALFACFGVGWPGLSRDTLRREIDYLRLRGLLTSSNDGPDWILGLTRDGIDLVEYTVPCDPGIARPTR